MILILAIPGCFASIVDSSLSRWLLRVMVVKGHQVELNVTYTISLPTFPLFLFSHPSFLLSHFSYIPGTTTEVWNQGWDGASLQACKLSLLLVICLCEWLQYFNLSLSILFPLFLPIILAHSPPLRPSLYPSLHLPAFPPCLRFPTSWYILQIPIIDIPGLGNLSAVTACEVQHVTSQNDKQNLEKAKAMTYLKGFYEGVRTSPDFWSHAISWCRLL